MHEQGSLLQIQTKKNIFYLFQEFTLQSPSASKYVCIRQEAQRQYTRYCLNYLCSASVFSKYLIAIGFAIASELYNTTVSIISIISLCILLLCCHKYTKSQILMSDLCKSETYIIKVLFVRLFYLENIQLKSLKKDYTILFCYFFKFIKMAQKILKMLSGFCNSLD